MTQVSCPSCRLRFARTLAAHLADCPSCGGPLDRSPAAEPVVGYWLFDPGSSEPQGAAPPSAIGQNP